MRKILTLVVLLMATNAQATDAPTVLIFGDSLSAGFGIDVDQSWAALLQERLEEQGYEHRVVNASISGETTEGGAARIDSAIGTFSPDLIILELGGNDGLRGFPPARIKGNLETIARRARDSGAGVVLLGIRIPTNYGTRYTQAFEAVYADVADELGIRWIEFFMEGVALNDELLQEDRIHPNVEAQPILLDNAWPIIRDTLDAQ
ncbi:MAG: arylesterase [Gammaproteobacteria bacterium]|jgi:acyl-CoA thioesterase-1|nr:arylesterase [Gammaproteobacteria bacterium]